MSLSRQEQLMLNHMERYGGISTRDAVRKYDIMRPQSRVNDLRRKGYNILTEMKYRKRRDGTTVRWAYYKLVS